jgi:hypothetical protein
MCKIPIRASAQIYILNFADFDAHRRACLEARRENRNTCKSKPKTNYSTQTIPFLSDSRLDTSNHQLLIITPRLALYPLNKILLDHALELGAHRIHKLLVPMTTDDTLDKQLILRAHASHRLLQPHGLCLRAVRGARYKQTQRVFHVARERRLDLRIQALVVALLVHLRNSLELGVVLARQDLADLRRVLADEAAHARLQLRHGLLDFLRVDGVRVLCAPCRDDHHVHLLRAGAEVALEVGFERALEEFLVFLLNGVHVGVAAADENVVDDDFFGAHAFHGIHEVVAVGYERSASDFDEALFEVAAGLLL